MNLLQRQPTPLAGLAVIQTTPVADERGSFARLFCETELGSIYPRPHVAQVNLSTTYRKGTVRGMHFQYSPMAEAKLIRCIRGTVFDVAVDVRRNSPTFLRWHAMELSENASQQLYIPEGFAHGFQALTDDVQLLYMHTRAWSGEHEGGLRHDDPRIGIAWPLPPQWLSAKDRSRRLIDETFEGFVE